MTRPTGTAAIDPSDMLGRVLTLPRQLRDARELAVRGPKLLGGETPSQVFVCGMGGSAIGGDFLRQMARAKSTIPVTVVRDDRLPRFDAKTACFIFVSYSGNTEETLGCWDEASRAGVRRAAITSGGELGARAKAAGVPVLEIPGGSPPRAALGWTAVPLLVAMERAGLLEIGSGEWEAAFDACDTVVREWGPGGDSADLLAAWADATFGRLAFVYAPSDPLAPVATRWICQINENAKTLAHAALFPEQNHNEIVGWEGEASPGERASLAVLDDPETSPRVRRRLAFVSGELESRGVSVHRFEAFPGPLLARLFSLAVLGDLASVALAARRGVDPTPVGSIDRLKATLSSGKMDGSRDSKSS